MESQRCLNTQDGLQDYLAVVKARRRFYGLLFSALPTIIHPPTWTLRRPIYLWFYGNTVNSRDVHGGRCQDTPTVKLASAPWCSATNTLDTPTHPLTLFIRLKLLCELT